MKGGRVFVIPGRLRNRKASIRVKRVPKEDNQTVETEEHSMGVRRSMARSDHWRWVSIPRWARHSSNVVSWRQRFMNVRTISSAVSVWFVENSALGGRLPAGSRVRTQRMGKERCVSLAIPQGGPRADLQDAFSLSIPIQGEALLRGLRIGQNPVERGETLAHHPRATDRVRVASHTKRHLDETC